MGLHLGGMMPENVVQIQQPIIAMVSKLITCWTPLFQARDSRIQKQTIFLSMPKLIQ